MKNQLSENMRRFGTKNLQESAQYTTKQGSKLEFRKVSGKGNLAEVKNKTTGKTYTYALYVKGWTGSDALNFKSIEPAGSGIRVNRWVSGGKTEAHDISQSKLQKIDSYLAQGKTVTYDGVVDIVFKRV
jgi:hypothetical protein